MLQIIPIDELKNPEEISDRCHSSHEPIFLTKDGYGDLVIMSIETYERIFGELSLYDRYVTQKLAEAEDAASKPDASWSDLGDAERRLSDKPYGK